MSSTNFIICFKKPPHTQTKKVFQKAIIYFWWLKDIISLLYSELSWLFLSCPQYFAESCHCWWECMCWVLASSEYLQVDAISGTALGDTHFPVLQDRSTVCGLTGIYLTIVFWLSLHNFTCICSTISWFSVQSTTLQEEWAEGQSCYLFTAEQAFPSPLIMDSSSLYGEIG